MGVLNQVEGAEHESAATFYFYLVCPALFALNRVVKIEEAAGCGRERKSGCVCVCGRTRKQTALLVCVAQRVLVRVAFLHLNLLEFDWRP